MNTERIKNGAVSVACCIFIMLAALVVRAPTASLTDTVEELRGDFFDPSGIIYFLEMDSYYHARLTDNYLASGSLGNMKTESGEAWDSLRYYPEGMTAEYQPGIVWLTSFLWKLNNCFSSIRLQVLEIWLASLMAAFSGAIVFLFVSGISNKAGGLTAGILVSCQSVFTERTLPGRYDTDMFIVLMDVLLIFLFAKALTAKKNMFRITAGAGFALTIAAYSLCWSGYSLLLAALTVAGGFLYLGCLFLHYRLKKNHSGYFRRFLRQPEVRTMTICFCVAVILILIVKGPGYYTRLISKVLPTDTIETGYVEADLFSSVVELKIPSVFPKDFKQSFVTYVPGQMFTVINGIGGLPTALLGVGGIVVMLLYILRPNRFRGLIPLSRRCAALYLCLFISWTAGCFLAVGRGVRFVEHLGVPVGILAGSFIGWLAPQPSGKKAAARLGCFFTTVVMCAAALVIPVSGALAISRYVQPGVTDASFQAMQWIGDHSEQPNAVVASWWDMGYFYEYASKHPTFWDGGCQRGNRAILISKALTTKDPEMSAGILKMLAGSGDRPVKYLEKKLGIKTAFEALWKIVPADEKSSLEILTAQFGFSDQEAAQAERLIHPLEDSEIYLVLTKEMMNMLGWFEYYSDWDFTGTKPIPFATVYNIKPDGSATLDTKSAEAEEFFQARSKEMIWHLFFGNGNKQTVFEKVFETGDRFTYIQIWKIR